MRGEPEFAPEMQFILDCCSPNSAGVRPAARGDELDWTRIEELARWHRVTPLVARRLGPASDLVPNSARRRISTFSLANELRCRYLTERLCEIINALAQASIDAIALKGPLLAQIAYGNFGLRVFSDLDLLVPRADLLRAAQVLKGVGFEADAYDEDAIQSGFFRAIEVNFRAPDGALNLDLHWDLSPGYYPFGPRGQDLWRRKIDAPVGRMRLPSLAPQDHLLYLAVHASRHGWPSLSQVCDIAYFVTREKLDWAAVAEYAAITRCARMLRLGILLSHNLLGVEIPAAILDATRADTAASAAAIKLGANLTDAGSREDFSLKNFTHSLEGIERRGERVRYLVVHAFAPTVIDWQWLPLTRSFYPAYYLLRPIRIAVALIRSLWLSQGAAESEPPLSAAARRRGLD